jgi:RHS repeat-associated protein
MSTRRRGQLEHSGTESRRHAGRAIRLAALVAAASLAFGIWTPSAGASTLTWPSLSVSGVWAWLTASDTAAHAPGQTLGTAAGGTHQVPASATRTQRKGAGTPPGTGRGQLAAYQAHGVVGRTVTSGPDTKAPGFNAATSQLVPADTTATQDVYQNANGTYTRNVYAGPVNYQTNSGSYAPIDTTLTSSGGRWREKANSLGVSFAPTSGAAVLGSMDLGGGESYGFGLAGAAAVTGTQSGSSVSYPGVLPETDLQETASPAGLNESLVLHSAAAPSSWVFPLTLAGLTPSLSANGSVSLISSAGTAAVVIPAGQAWDSAPRGRSGLPANTVPTTWQLVSYNGGPALQLSLPAGWLSDPSRVFPVTVDPAGDEGVTGTTYAEHGSTDVDHSGATLMPVGTYDQGADEARTFLAFGNVGDLGLQDYHLTAASLSLFDAWAWQCTTAEEFDAYNITSPWSLTSITWPGPSTGDEMGSLSEVAPAAACSNSNPPNPSVGNWMTMPLNSTGVADINAWTSYRLGNQVSFGMMLSAANVGATGDPAWKQFDGAADGTGYMPYLSLTYATDVPPQINGVYPQSDYNATSLTPELQTSGSDPGNGPDPLGYYFAVYNSAGTLVANSTSATTPGAAPGPTPVCNQTDYSTGWLSTPYWTVPENELSWGQAYDWIAVDCNGLNWGSSQPEYFTTQVPQPTVGQATQNGGNQGVRPGGSDYTTSATDAQVSTVGPSLSIERDYDSDNLSRAGAFGAGWSSILDMKVTPGLTDAAGNTDTVVVTYPDGSQVGFGKNYDGSFAAPEGRYATLAAVSSGGYTLTDKNDTVYTFTQPLGPTGVYGISKIADALGNVLSFTWAAGCPGTAACEITQMTSASGRALYLTWSTSSGATSAHVASVRTDPVTSGTPSTALTWQYGYSGDELTSVCPPISATACTTYTYAEGTDYPDAVLGTGPHSYWRLDESSGTAAASSVLANEQTDAAGYTNVTLGQPGPLPGSNATAAGFNGSSSYMTLPSGLVSGSNYQSFGVWFKTSTAGGVIFSDSKTAITADSTTGYYTPGMYVGSDGYLNAEYWYTPGEAAAPMRSTAAVDNGQWHFAVLTAAGDTETLYIDGKVQQTLTSIAVSNDDVNGSYGTMTNDYIGAGFIGSSWPDESNNGNTTATPEYFSGSISDVGFWDRPLTGAEVTGLYQAGTTAAQQLSQVTRPSGSLYAQVAYSTVTGAVSQVTDDNGGTWHIAAPTVSGSSQVYVAAILGQGPADYWRLGDTGTSTAVNQVSGGGPTAYNNVTQGVAGPFADSTADSFNGTSSYLQLPVTDQGQTGPASVEMWFRVPAGNTAGGVLYAEQSSPLGQSPSSWAPALYVGSDAKLHGWFWGSGSQVVSASAVNDGKWHMVALTSSGASQAVYLDGTLIGVSAAPQAFPVNDVYVGAGHVSTWPAAPANSDGYFTGSISDVAFFHTQLSAAQVTGAYQAAQAHPSSQIYATSVLRQAPTDYWRLGDTGTSGPVNQVSGGGTATYSNVTKGVAGPFADSTAVTFNGTSSYLQVPANEQIVSGPGSVQMWFQVPAGNTAGGVLWDEMNTALGTSPTNWVPGLYVGTDGMLRGAFWTGSVSNQILSSSPVNDGKWHMVTLTTSGSDESLYLDGQLLGTLPDTLQSTGASYDYVGAGHVASWPAAPANSDGYFTGSISDVAFFHTQLSAAQVTAEWQGAQSAQGLTPVETQAVTDPGGHTVSYQMDPLKGDRMIAQTDALGNTTTFGYDTSGFQDSVTDPDGNVTLTGHDVRGNVVSQTTCQNWAAQNCSTEYMTYFPDDTSTNLTPDPRNDLALSDAAAGSASATDPTYLTSYAYNSQGELTSETGPPVPGFPNGRITTYTYSTSSTPAYGASGQQSGTTPPGLLLTDTTPGGAVTSSEYYSNGDVYQVTDPDGMRTIYTYDGLGRTLSKTVYSTSYPAGLTTSYAYDQMGQVITETDPTVTDPAPGTPHTAQISTTYDADGDVLSQTVADNTPVSQGGDPARTQTNTYNSHDQLASSTDGTGNTTKYTYDAYGNAASQTDPAGNTIDYTYDPDGSLLTQVLANYNGTASGSCQTVSGGLVESSRTYDPAGQLASITNGNCDTTAYTYTGNGLQSTISRCSAWTGTSCGGSTYVEQANTYNAADQLLTQVTNNGQTTTNYAVDAAGQTQSQTLDPNGLDRTTTYSYSPDDAVLSQKVYGPASSTPPVTSVTAQVWGGGGGGSGSNFNDCCAAPGGGGGEYASQSVAVTPGAVYTVVVGAGGAGGAGGTTTGTAGSNSTFTGDSAKVIAHGGGAGSTDSSNQFGGAGGTDSPNSIHYNGGTGGTGSTTDVYRGGGGGGSGGTSSVGNAGASGQALGYGGAAVAGGGAGGGGGGAGTTTSGDYPGSAGSAPGGGGGGGQAYSINEPGGSGAAGQVTLTWNGGTATWSTPGTYQWTAPLPPISLASVTGYTYDPMGNMTSETVHDDTTSLIPSGSWPLNAPTGTPSGSSAETYAPDQSGNGNTGILNSGASWASGGGVTLDGSTGAVTTSGPAVNTAGSYAVSAWVKLNSITAGNQTVLSQDGTTNGGFYLMYNTYYGNGWSLAFANSDTSGSAVSGVWGPAGQAGTWTYLTGVYNASSHTATLYVNGTSVGSISYTGWNATGPFTIGRGLYQGSDADYLGGTVANVQTYPYALSASQVSQLYGEGRNGNALGEQQQTTSWLLDSRGLPTSMTDPNGNTTSYVYDQAGQLASTTDPVVTTNVYGAGPLAVAPVSYTGYNTFGEQVLTKDPNGNEVFTSYDNNGRPVAMTEPDYTPPDGSGLITGAHTTTTYNSLGQVASETDPLGNVTSYTYDQLGDVTSETTPAGTISYTYDANGDQLSATSPTGAVTDATYDFLGRQVTSTQVERYPSAASYNTTSSYGPNGTSPWETSATTPDGVVTTYGHDAAGEQTSVTDGAGNTTSYTYDAAGRLTTTTNPDGTSTTTSYDEAGNPIGTSDYSSSGSLLRSDSATYDANGNQLTATDYRGNTTSYSYNAENALTGEVQPVTSTSSITTSFGYDAAGNPTLYTDGNGSNWWTTYNSWNLPESRIEPTTAAAPTAADSTFTTSYNADGNPVQLSEPGGITVTDTYNNMQELTGQSGTGASAATTSRSFGYNADGELTSASAPGGTDAFTYNDRGLVLSAAGPSGTSSFAYNGDGLSSSVTDAAGTTSYTYDNADRLATLSDPATGTTLSYAYNQESQVSKITYGSGGNFQSYNYNGLHQLTSDTLQTAGGATVASIGYTYDLNGNLATKDTTGFGTAANNSYNYNYADELTSWNNGTTTTSYAYDGAGNRTQVGSKTYTYDARDELTSDGTSTYSYTMAGTLASVAGPNGTTNYTSDAFGQTITAAGQTYGYDALGRVVSDTGGSGSGYNFSYDGPSSTLASDGVSTYTWDPSGTSLVGVGVAGSPSAGVLALTDAHTDVVGAFTASGSSLSGSAVYDPLGNVLSSAGLAGQLGYQSAWTDPATKQVHMGARWYDPAAGQFTSRDSVSVNPVPDSAAANPFAYVADNPLTGTDPTGHMLMMDAGGGGYVAPHPAPRPAPPKPSCSWFSCAWHAVTHTVSRAYHATVRTAVHVYHAAVRVVHTAADVIGAAADYTGMALNADLAEARLEIGHIAHDVSTAVADAAAVGGSMVSHTWRAVASATAAGYHAVTRTAEHAYQSAVNVVHTAIHDVARAATATATFIKNHGAAIAGFVVSIAVFAGCDAALGIASGGIGAIAGAAACGELAGAAGNAVSYGITAAQTGKFSWSGLLKTTAQGAVEGALAGGLGAGAGELLGGIGSRLLADGLATDGAGAAIRAAADGATNDATAAAADGTDVAALGEHGGEEPGGTAAEETPTLADQAGTDARQLVQAGCGQSFTAGTKVLLASGAAIPISLLKAGDKVLATNVKTGKTRAEAVSAVLLNHDKDLYDLTIMTATGSAVIHTTSNHPFFDLTSHRWVKAGALKYGDQLRTSDGAMATVSGGSTPKVTTGWMWDISVPGGNDHDFYIDTAAAAVLVHNCPMPGSAGQPFDQDQQALIQLAKEAKQLGGLDQQEAEILSDWADEYGLSGHGPAVHPGRSGFGGTVPHINVGPIKHIPVMP